jgi:hypothetical protein
MPGENGFWRDDSRDLVEELAAEQNALGCQAATIVICEAQALAAKLLLEKAILFAEEVDDVRLVLVEPAGQDDDDELEGVAGSSRYRRWRQR